MDTVDERLAMWGETWITDQPRQHHDDELITTEQAAAAARVDAATIYTWVNRKRLPVHKLGRENRYFAADVYQLSESIRHRR